MHHPAYDVLRRYTDMVETRNFTVPARNIDAMKLALKDHNVQVGEPGVPVDVGHGFKLSYVYVEASGLLAVTLDGPRILMSVAWGRINSAITPFTS